MTALEKLLNTYRQALVTEREKDIYFEELIVCCLHNEATYPATTEPIRLAAEMATRATRLSYSSV